MKIEMRKVLDVRPYERNPRINDAAVESVAESIRQFGFRQPIVVDSEGVIIVGHTRLKAAQKLGMTEVPVHVAVDMPPEKAKAYRIADNKLAELAEWDKELLPLELKDLQGMNFDLDVLGFDAEDLAQVLSGGVNPGLTDPDSVPAPPDEAVTQAGDLWILGNHRLLCGDSSKPGDVDRLLAGAKIQLANTDPPYGVRVEPRSNNAIAAGPSSFGEPGIKNHQGFDVARDKSKSHGTTQKMRAKDRPLVNDFLSDEDFIQMLDAWFGNITRVLEPGHGFFIWGGYANLANYPPVLKKHGLYFSQAIVWDKLHPVLSRKDFMGAFELAFYGWKEGAAHRFYGPNNAQDIWHIKKINPQSMEHLTQKSVELAVRAILYSSLKGENVLDLFGGSGSTLIGCQQTEQRAYLMEIDRLYCDVIADRFQRFSGIPAVLERTGTSPIPMKPREEDMR